MKVATFALLSMLASTKARSNLRQRGQTDRGLQKDNDKGKEDKELLDEISSLVHVNKNEEPKDMKNDDNKDDKNEDKKDDKNDDKKDDKNDDKKDDKKQETLIEEDIMCEKSILSSPVTTESTGTPEGKEGKGDTTVGNEKGCGKANDEKDKDKGNKEAEDVKNPDAKQDKDKGEKNDNIKEDNKKDKNGKDNKNDLDFEVSDSELLNPP